jgi:dienelactone hydrolase
MKARAWILATALAATAAGGAGAQGAYTPASTPIGTGPYKAIMEVDPRLPTHTVYRPADLAALKGAKLPIVAWGNGACRNAGNIFRQHLSEVASHGFLAIAIGPIGTPADEADPAAPRPGATPPPPRDRNNLPPPASHSSQLVDAIDWAIAENGRQGSKLYGRLDTTRIAVMGQSCGGVQAIEASADPRVTTTVVWNSGLFPEPTTMGGGKALSKADLAAYHGPVAYISGDQSDQAFVNAEDDFDRIAQVPVFRAWEKGVGHSGTHRQPNGGDFGKVSVAWLSWQLKGDQAAARMFTGADCGLCGDAKWVVKKKGM